MHIDNLTHLGIPGTKIKIRSSNREREVSSSLFLTPAFENQDPFSVVLQGTASNQLVIRNNPRKSKVRQVTRNNPRKSKGN